MTAAIKLQLSAEFLPSPDRTRLEEEVEKFEIRWNLPNCMGALDGKHFAIMNHVHKGTVFHNYKGFFSHVLLAIVGADYKFLFVDIGGTGCSNDAGLFEDSTFGSAILDGRMVLPHKRLLPGTDIKAPYVFVGDKVFPNLTCLLRPFPKTNLGLQEKVFNYHLSRARRVVENAFGILAVRFRIFHTKIYADAELVDDLIHMCIILHNLLIKPGDRLCAAADGQGEQDQTVEVCGFGDLPHPRCPRTMQEAYDEGSLYEVLYE